jgi:hypothetical protein
MIFTVLLQTRLHHSKLIFQLSLTLRVNFSCRLLGLIPTDDGASYITSLVFIPRSTHLWLSLAVAYLRLVYYNRLSCGRLVGILNRNDKWFTGRIHQSATLRLYAPFRNLGITTLRYLAPFLNLGIFSQAYSRLCEGRWLEPAIVLL